MNPDRPLEGARILIAEDNAILALDLMDVLRNAGAEIVGPAATLTKALALANSASLTLAVLDINLGRELVFPAAQVLKERGVGVIFLTGHSETEAISQDWPEAQLITKPAPLKLLMRTVCEAYRGAGICAIHGCRYCERRQR
ncbi:MAG: response regulator [Rhodomicrobium sp.]